MALVGCFKCICERPANDGQYPGFGILCTKAGWGINIYYDIGAAYLQKLLG